MWKKKRQLIIKLICTGLLSEVLMQECGSLRIDSGRIGSVPLILVIVLWTFLEGFGGLDYYRYNPSIRTLMSTLLVDIPLIFICLAIWFPGSRLRLYLGRLATIIWWVLMAFYSLMIFGEIEHAELIALIIYFILILSKIAVSISLWNHQK